MSNDDTYFVFRTSDGVSIIGRVLSVSDGAITVDRPMHMLLVTTEDGSVQLQLRKYIREAVSTKVVIFKNSIVSTYEPSPELIEHYNKVTDLYNDKQSPEIMEALIEKSLTKPVHH